MPKWGSQKNVLRHPIIGSRITTPREVPIGRILSGETANSHILTFNYAIPPAVPRAYRDLEADLAGKFKERMEGAGFAHSKKLLSEISRSETSDRIHGYKVLRLRFEARKLTNRRARTKARPVIEERLREFGVLKKQAELLYDFGKEVVRRHFPEI